MIYRFNSDLKFFGWSKGPIPANYINAKHVDKAHIAEHYTLVRKTKSSRAYKRENKLLDNQKQKTHINSIRRTDSPVIPIDTNSTFVAAFGNMCLTKNLHENASGRLMNKKSTERYMRAYKRYFFANDIVLKKISEVCVEDIEELFRDILRRFNDVSEKELELVRIILNQTFKHACKVGACKENMYKKFKKTTLMTIRFVYVDVVEESGAAYEK